MKLTDKQRKELTTKIYDLVMKFNHPELGLNYLALRPAISKFLKKWSKSK